MSQTKSQQAHTAHRARHTRFGLGEKCSADFYKFLQQTRLTEQQPLNLALGDCAEYRTHSERKLLKRFEKESRKSLAMALDGNVAKEVDIRDEHHLEKLGCA